LRLRDPVDKLALVELPFRFALCNELFEKVPFSEACTRLSELGYSGIEIAPFTLAEDPLALSQGARRDLRRTIGDHRLSFVGLHWLLVSPPGLHVTTADLAVRKRSWEYVRHFIDLCADLGDAGRDGAGVVVFGSPKQRSAISGMTREEAMRIFKDELAAVAPHAEARRVQLLVEALPVAQSNIINSLSEAVDIVESIGSPAVQTMFDVHNAVDEEIPHSDLIRKYIRYIRHVHVNEFDGREPGASGYDFSKLLETLAALQYRHWISLEVFDFSRDTREIARRGLSHLQSSLQSAGVTKTL
jgi:D-psicose/D-tagatose/L-ribulose 3-epimerase